MRVLVACEFSGRVRDAFAAVGHDAWSCDTEPSEASGNHIQDDVLLHLEDGWDLMVAHPPCTYLSRAGGAYYKVPERIAKAEEAMAFVLALWSSSVPRIAIENPIGRLSSWWMLPSQYVQPWQFGDPWTKKTCLWLKNLPPLFATRVVTPAPGIRRSSKPQWKGGAVTYGAFMRSHRSAKDRSRTFPGIAAAMAQQWGAEDWHL